MINAAKTPKLLYRSFAYFAMFGLVVAPVGAPLAQSERRATALEEVVVTAQKREESLQDAPISLAVFGAEALENLGVSEMGEIAEYVPNLSMRKSPASQDNYIVGIRGVVAGGTDLLTDPRVGIYVDGIYLGRTVGQAFDINDLERVEVLRGPQGTLYGRNTVGGAINLITAKPSGEFSFKQKLSGGSDGLFESRTSVNLDTISLQGFGDLKASFSYLTKEDDGYIQNSADNDALFGSGEHEAFRVALLWEYSDTLSVDYRYDNSERDTYPTTDQLTRVIPTPFGNPLLSHGPILTQALADADQDRVSKISRVLGSEREVDGNYSNIDGHSLTVEWDTGQWGVFKSITGYREWDSAADGSDFGSWDFANVEVVTGVDGNGDPVMGPALGQIWIQDPNDQLGRFNTAANVGDSTAFSVFYGSLDSEQEQFSQEFQLVGDMMGGDLQYTVGVFYFEEETAEIDIQNFTLPASVLLADPRNAALFASAPANNGNWQEVYTGSPYFYYGQDVTSQGLYGQVDYQISPNLKGSLGLRYTEDEKDAFIENGASGADLDGAAVKTTVGLAACQGPGAVLYPEGSTALSRGCVRAEGDESWDNFSGFVNLNYSISELTNLYVTVSTGYTAGGFNARGASVSTIANDPFGEETLTNYEFGWKYESADRQTRLNGAAFWVEYEDRQIPQFEAGTNGATSVIENAGEQEQSGFEFDLTRLLSEGVTLMLSYGYLDAEFKKYVTGKLDATTGFPTNPGVNDDLASDSTVIVPHAPKHTAAVQLMYDFEPLPIGDFSFWFGATYHSSLVYDAQLHNYNTTGEYHLFNARLNWDINTGGSLPGQLRASVWGQNITDEEVRGFGIDFGQLGFALNTYLNVGTYGIDLVYNY